MTDTDKTGDGTRPPRSPAFGPLGRVLFVLFIAAAIAVVWVSNTWLTQRYTESTRSRAELRIALYTGNLISELQRNSVVPLLLSRDPAFISALNSEDFVNSSQRLISYRDEIGAQSLLLLDQTGRAVAATDRERLGSNHRSSPYFVNALRSSDTVFTTADRMVASSKVV